MAKKAFDLGELLRSQGAADLSAGQEVIVRLALADIDDDENNFYSMAGIEELAANIDTVGLLDPIRVRPNPAMPGRYFIVSGHRRRAAVALLAQDDPDKWERVPCIVDHAEVPEAMQELRLIFANSDTRRMSGYDLSRQAERVEALLYELKEQGWEFSGRMRDHVAQACQTSKSKLARLKVIREKLIPELAKEWEAGRLNESVALAFATHPAAVQARANWVMRNRHSPDLWQASEVESVLLVEERRQQKAEGAPQPVPDSGTSSGGFDAEDYIRQLAAERRLLRKAIAEHWGPEFARVLRRSAVTRADAVTVLKEEYRHSGTGGMKVDYDGTPTGLMVEWPHEKRFLARWTDIFDQLALIAIERWAQESDKPKAPPPEPWEPVWKSVTEDDPPKEGQFVMVVDASGCMQPAVYWRARYMDATPRSVGNNVINHVRFWMPRPALPEGRRWQGEETLQRMLGKLTAEK